MHIGIALHVRFQAVLFVQQENDFPFQTFNGWISVFRAEFVKVGNARRVKQFFGSNEFFAEVLKQHFVEFIKGFEVEFFAAFRLHKDDNRQSVFVSVHPHSDFFKTFVEVDHRAVRFQHIAVQTLDSEPVGGFHLIRVKFDTSDTGVELFGNRVEDIIVLLSHYRRKRAVIKILRFGSEPRFVTVVRRDIPYLVKLCAEDFCHIGAGKKILVVHL